MQISQVFKVFSLSILVLTVPIVAQAAGSGTAKDAGSASSNVVGDYDFKDPKGVNAITFVLDSLLEPIVGVANGVSGSLHYETGNPKALTGKIEVAASSLMTPNSKMTEVLHSEDWLNAEKHPTLTFQIKEVKNAKETDENQCTLEAVGEFTCKGITKKVTLPELKVTFIKDGAIKRNRAKEGDLIVVRTKFVITRTDFDINLGTPFTAVADDIELDVRLVGHTKK